MISSVSKEKLNDYKGFVEKFKPKKTTDDCYTPPEVYDLVLNFVIDEYKIDKNKVVRPFYPGGDYETFDYSDGKIVIDNPPFSILSKIVRFYLERNIAFFLFAPNLTFFSVDYDACLIAVGAIIEYENKAKISTSFITNLDDKKIKTAPKLYKSLTDLLPKNNLPKYDYPDYLITSSKLTKLNKKGVNFSVNKEEVHFIRSLDSQKKYKKSIFGAGFLISEKKAEELKKLNEAEEGDDIENRFIWSLSDNEKEIIKNLK